MECLDANTVQDLMSGSLDDRARTMAHLDSCADCRSLISLIAKDASRAAAIAALRGIGETSDIALQATDRADSERTTIGKLADRAFGETVATVSAPLPPPGESADLSLMMQSGLRQIGKTFGRYTLVDRIGAGAMGVVYRADDPGLGRRVALKLLHKPDPELTDRLIREARSMAQVNHPNVVAVYDAGVSEGSTYIAMELVIGGSLREWQQAKRTQPEIIAKYVAAGRGLAAAHAAGIIHRDFKPDNVMVGGDDRVRVTDFGLASARPSEDVGMEVGEAIELSQEGMVLGTPAYMAPEQFTGGNVDPRTDQFNYCVALYEALYKQRPFKGKTFDELGDAVCDGKVRPPPPGAVVSGELRAIVLRGLSVRPGDRYPTMEHLLDQLGRDRTRRLRTIAIASAIFAAAIGLGIGADFVVRDRVSDENNQSFSATAVQIGRAFGLLAGRFDANANQMYHQAAIREVTSYRDQNDFGLGSSEDDAESRGKIRDLLVSQDWDLWRKAAGRTLVVAIADYKGRLFFSSAGQHWGGDRILEIPWLKAAVLAGKERTMVLQPTSDPSLLDSKLLGEKPTYKLAFFFARTLFLGAEDAKEQSGTLVQALDASQLVDDIRLDREMQLSIVSRDKVSDSDYRADDNEVSKRVPPALIAAALDSDGIVEADHDGVSYQVKAEQLIGLDQEPLGHVVMARKLGSVLSGFFPGARTVFALAVLLALGVAIGTTIQVRRLAR